MQHQPTNSSISGEQRIHVCMTEKEGGRDLEGDGMHVCMYSCMCASLCEWYVCCVWALREDDIWEMEKWSKRGDRRGSRLYKILNATKSSHYPQIRR